MTNEDLQQIQSLVTSARKVLVLTHANPTVDTMASALALYLALVKLGKDVTVAMDGEVLVEVSNLVGVDKVKTSLSTSGGGSLLLTYKPYQLGDFEDVKYNENPAAVGLSEDTFSMTIKLRPGFVPETRNFQFNLAGGPASLFDLIITVEILEPTQAGKLYDAQMFANAQVINIDNHDPNKDYGRFNLVEPDAASISEIVTFFLRAINAQIDADMARNLYQGIVQASQNFQNPKVAAATFEAAAICLRAGAKQGARGEQLGASNKQQVSQRPQMGQPQHQVVPPAQPAPQNAQSIPSDWTQPKAYRGTSVV
ncbi:MAG: Phosphoesterase RecJ domain protein [Microgenomates group bacterium GW2011_GWA1_48_10]|uniref:DDH domain-containing protein n=1 Tax=Candidatus Gottesmanbacteria bacterium RIFCSPHIGHO2_01_FULL_47_48 TaxID=1798381 RepID=A0A1F6A515_9BACT|nr:MAG: Phosphoesterase RecJ domain protein [Microgenomates group bacterium GW2011_GWA1_48_10]OGG19789.1 MAG: hypothetical protein A2721_01295 [Candidatus Gottesmanbacteria bacterium RIFCSPHIGHO2_01_FULL_47_48]